MKALILTGTLAIAATFSSAHAAQPALVVTGTNGSFIDGYTRMIGWQFKVTSTVTVTSLGWFDWAQDGLARSHEIGLWDNATQTLVAYAEVPQGTAAALDGYFRWIELAAPVALLPGVSYRIAGLDIGNHGDPHVWVDTLVGYNAQVSGLTVNASLQMAGPGTAVGAVATAFGYPAPQIDDARSALLGPNLAVGVVPEPASAGLLLGGLALLRACRRPRLQAPR